VSGSTGSILRAPSESATRASSASASALSTPIDHPPAVFPETFAAPRMVDDSGLSTYPPGTCISRCGVRPTRRGLKRWAVPSLKRKISVPSRKKGRFSGNRIG
jgi:hypothetical protein